MSKDTHCILNRREINCSASTASPNTIMNYSNKKVILNISKIIIFAFVISLKFFTINAFSLAVQQDPIGIYCIKDNGIRAISEWVEIDFEGDNYLEYYYFDSNGYLIMNGITPDGYIVNERGQWIENGIVQRKYYAIPTTKKITNDSNNTNIKRDQPRLRNDDRNYIFVIALVIIVLIIFLYIKSLSSDNTQYKRKNYDNYKAPYQSNYSRNTTINNDTTISRSIWWHLRSDTDKRGEEGEDAASERLKYLGKDFVVLRNVNLPRSNKEPVQIDFLCISKKGIFVIEVKNWLGKVTGNYEDEIWHSQFNYTINDQKNPVKQNEWHVDVVKRFIRQSMIFHSIVVFTDRADIGWLDKKQNRTYITNIDNLNNVIYNIYESTKVIPYGNYKSVAGNLRKYAE